MSFGELHCEPGADGAGSAALPDGGKCDGFGREEISGQVTKGSEVSVARQLRGGVEALHEDSGLGALVGHHESVSHALQGRRREAPRRPEATHRRKSKLSFEPNMVRDFTLAKQCRAESASVCNFGDKLWPGSNRSVSSWFRRQMPGVYPPMLSYEHQGDRGPLIVFLHWLGGGAQTWQELSHGLARRGLRCAALDLPGFGQGVQEPATDVNHAVEAAVETIRALRAADPGTPWLLAGHSMGGKIAMITARRALDGEAGLEGLCGLLLVSPSPPSPEPIAETRREEHLDTFGTPTDDPDDRRRDAERWVTKNTGKLPLPRTICERAINGVLAIPPPSFAAWFRQGSKEDWSARVGTLDVPALLFTGTEETSLGIDVQRTQTLPHLPQATHVQIEAAKHLTPVERPGELLEHVTEFLGAIGLPLATPETHAGTAALMDSRRTSSQTRGVMVDRLAANRSWNHRPGVFSPPEFRSLRALAGIIVPDAPIDLAAALDEQLAAAKGDGWRFAALPADVEAWRCGLLSLDQAARRGFGVSFLALYPDQQQALLHQAADGKLGHGLLGAIPLTAASQAYSAEEMKQWFQDVRAEFTRLYVADPRTMDRMAYSGFADDLGFTQIELGQGEEVAL